MPYCRTPSQHLGLSILNDFVNMIVYRSQIIRTGINQLTNSHILAGAALYVGSNLFLGVGPAATLIHLLLILTFITNRLMRQENKTVFICRELSDEKVFDSRVPRVYLYSRTAMMVGFEEAGEPADIAKVKDWDVTKVQFKNSAHCRHVREDEAKYWAAVF